MKRVFCLGLLIFLSLSLICGSVVRSEQAGTIEEQRLKEIEKELAQNKQKLEKAKKEEQAVLGRLVVIKTELTKTKTNLNLTQNKITVNEKKIGTLASEIRELEQALSTKQSRLRQRLVEVYKNSSLNYFQLLLTAESMSDFFNRLYFFRKIVEFDSELMMAVRTDFQKSTQKKQLLQSKTKEIKSLAEEISQKKQEITKQASEKSQVYEQLKVRRKTYEAKIAELGKSSKDLEVLILKKAAGSRDGVVRGSGQLTWPLIGKITSRFGWRRHPLWGRRDFHTGVDIAAKYGTPIKAADSGEVIFAGWWDGYGKAIVINHGHSISTVYGHQSRLYKKVGDTVVKGQVIGLVGSTGYSTGPHLHFEVRLKGKPQDPMPYLPK
ncbi:hypothetical protein COT42_00555 [Candidatus Saganbacteria bacterium CG08_land_8_20_14_0_20_45_16]|uniref:Uncharacterized protein n=1 Tax=Candidatus Saganbacteria bacterium CG08_land_8_20_14_0_20_45_16 TaxID=2014293 RepID=A0A2H0Y1Q6_UNCSA|nr:MAG: hypothetical protein COT42_00555 [Candidatus Saganbacteria bacterium CG08_land_8_20_14_0_20_45_16]